MPTYGKLLSLRNRTTSGEFGAGNVHRSGREPSPVANMVAQMRCRIVLLT
jgi:hypothetical protein